MNGYLLAAAGGSLTGSGVAVAARRLLPSAPPRLAAALAAMEQVHRSVPSLVPSLPGRPAADPAGAAGWQLRVGHFLGARAPGLVGRRTRAADLAIVGLTGEALLGRQGLLALFGLLLPSLALAPLAAAGASLPFVVPAGVSLASAAVFFHVPAWELRDRAARARAEFRAALTAYFDLVALERVAGGGAADALERAADVGHGWVFRRLADTLSAARYAGGTPWAALSRLGGQLGVDELADLADIVTGAGEGGNAIFTSLVVKADALRSQTLTDAKTVANSRSDSMSLPTAVLLTGFLLLLAYPAIAGLLNSGG